MIVPHSTRKTLPSLLLRSRISKIFLVLLLFTTTILLALNSFQFSPPGKPSSPFPQCGEGASDHGKRPQSLKFLAEGEKYMLYSPHSGFNNQVSEFKNALLIAGILNRTLVVPPVLDHHALALGSCPKFRVQSPTELRLSLWKEIIRMSEENRYVSIADIVNVSAATSLVKVIDLRVFSQMWCGINMQSACSGSLCCSISALRSWGKQDECISLLSGSVESPNGCVYVVEDDCRTTVWTFQTDDDVLDSFQPSKEQRERKKIRYVRKRRDVYKTLGPGSKADAATVVSFGSLFSSPYRGTELHVDIHDAPHDVRVQSLLRKIEYLPFVEEITEAGKNYVKDEIGAPFICGQLRLLDGQFKNHREATVTVLRDKIQSLRDQLQSKSDLINIFVMTDLQPANWTGTYLDELANSPHAYKVYNLHEEDELVKEAAKKLMAREHAIRSGFFWSGDDDYETRKGKVACSHRAVLPDILLYIQETVCSCASLGFVGTAGSTIAENIELMRKNNLCFDAKR